MSSPSPPLKPIIVYGRSGPNPPKVHMVCDELNIPYTITDVQTSELKAPAYLAVNPNGRMPSIHDPNTNLTLWESGAILEYLVDTYDTERKISFAPGSHEYHLARQWLFFQVSGQGPYYGQAVWFSKFHAEKIPSAAERYYREMERLTGVLEMHLKAQKKGDDGPWLVGGRFSYADLAFVPWQIMATGMFENEVDVSQYTEVKGWIERIVQREAVGKAVAKFPKMK